MLILINPSAVRQEHVFNRCVDGPKLVGVSSFGAIKLPVTFLFGFCFVTGLSPFMHQIFTPLIFLLKVQLKTIALMDKFMD